MHASCSHAAAQRHKAQLALTGFEAAIRLINDISATATADHTAITVTVFQRLKAVTDLHCSIIQVMFWQMKSAGNTDALLKLEARA